MCGIVGYIDLNGRRIAEANLLNVMADKVRHRGPDSVGTYIDGSLGLGFRRLSIVDLDTGDQPMYNEDRSTVLVCNGEIFNYPELRGELEAAGHRFSSNCDVEAVVHLYETCGPSVPERLNGQFSFALYDKNRRRLMLARDPFGIAPLFYTVQDGHLVFASEIKAILRHPKVGRAVDLVGLDQIVCFPGLVSPRTMFEGICALPPGHRLLVEDGRVTIEKYWDLDYPQDGSGSTRALEEYEEELKSLFKVSVRRRLQADVPVGVYISGGLDSCMVAGIMRQIMPDADLNSFAVSFDERTVTEEKYQRLMAKAVGSRHHEIRFEWTDIAQNLSRMIYHAECPVKETYNTCMMALSAKTRAEGVKVVLGGEGADELFAGYPGYRFDAFAARSPSSLSPEEALIRKTLWGDEQVSYEKTYSNFSNERRSIYSDAAWERLSAENALSGPPFDGSPLRGRHRLHQRSYLDVRLRLADHLLSDHGDRMLMAHSVEGRYPFLDRDIVDFARRLPVNFKLNGLEEKYILKRIAGDFVPPQIVGREKFGFHAPGSPWLLAQNLDWVNELLSPERIRHQGYFSVETVETLKRRYADPAFRLDPRTDEDVLLLVLSFSIFLDLFELPPAA